ncbi:hypothetical protein ACFLZ0_00175 [Patescibacteria group bacterium]
MNNIPKAFVTLKCGKKKCVKGKKDNVVKRSCIYCKYLEKDQVIDFIFKLDRIISASALAR